MTDYEAIRKDLYESFHDTFHKLYISELKDQIADKDEIITANDHVIAEQQTEIESLRFQLDGVIKMRNEAENEIKRLRTALEQLVGAIADPTSQKSIPLALRSARAALAQEKPNDR
jgi:peptidoglycan hydrolase CwlO-like protein